MQDDAGSDRAQQRPHEVLTHNVHGIPSPHKARICMLAWIRAGAHVVCAQETWVDGLHSKSQAEVAQVGRSTWGAQNHQESVSRFPHG
jgi:hypothetical protein